jgi:DNA-binding NtrC family response regulator
LEVFLKRKLLILKKSSFWAEIREELSISWDVYVARDINQALSLHEQHKFSVGLCLLEFKCSSYESCLIAKSCLLDYCHNDVDIGQLNHLFNSTTAIKWVMGIPEGCNHPESYSAEKGLVAEYCFDYVTLPPDIPRMMFTLGHAYGMSKLNYSKNKVVKKFSSHFGIIGDSPVMQDFYLALEKVIEEDCATLIEGETGTGKDLAARAIHDNSSRSKAPFVAINCGAIPKDLIQAELFGFEKGAFTGALNRKTGCIENANGGTLFLDEIGDLPRSLQVNLLRFLEDKTIIRIGGSEKIPVNVRVLAATHVDLKDAVKRGDFREDLYFRLRVLQLKTPPLREREGDIELLAHYFLKLFSADRNYKAKKFHPDALFLLNCYYWSGNIRELKNCVQHALVMSENKQIIPSDLGLDQDLKTEMLQTLEQARATTDRELIIKCLRLYNQNISRTAEALGITRVSLYRLAQKYNIPFLGKDSKE